MAESISTGPRIRLRFWGLTAGFELTWHSLNTCLLLTGLLIVWFADNRWLDLLGVFVGGMHISGRQVVPRSEWGRLVEVAKTFTLEK